MMFDILETLLVSIVETFVGTAVILLFIFIFFRDKLTKRFRGQVDERFINRKPKALFLLIALPLFILIFGYTTMKSYWGNDVIGSAFSRNNFSTSYYVNISQDINTSKAERLKADLRQETSDDGSKNIILERVYLDDGGYISFLKAEDYEITLNFKEKALCVDDDGKKWYIELTGDKAK